MLNLKVFLKFLNLFAIEVSPALKKWYDKWLYDKSYFKITDWLYLDISGFKIF